MEENITSYWLETLMQNWEIITNQKSIVQNVTVLNSFTTGRDHRLVRAKIKLNTRVQRSKLTKKNVVIDMSKLKEKSVEYIETMSEELGSLNTESFSIDELNSKIVNLMNEFIQ